MQQIFDAGCSAQMYAIQGRDFSFPDLTVELCPLCRADLLHKHGFYSRYLILLHFEGMILIRRYICKECGHTVSLLPSFAHPGRAYGIEAIIHVLAEFYVEKRYVSEICTFSVCSRQLLRWFRLRIKENLNMLIMTLTEVLSLRAPPVTETAAKERAGQFFECIRQLNTKDISLKIFERTRKTYLSPLPR
jgi:transposase-like protein